ncbi:MAG: diacylglycerol kinase family protein [Planctomycetaceae bacterium]|jgi:diacylglycerol kinase|nr:diacylglycerol kinase family protein [Planctomycetaceae bacterium]
MATKHKKIFFARAKKKRIRHRILPRAEPTPFMHRKRTWTNKFRDAFVGLISSFRGQSSYNAHFGAAVIVILFALVLGNFDVIRWSILILCVVAVIVTEMLNTSIETLAKGITDKYDPKIGLALDIAGGAVLFVSIGTAVIGIIIFTESILRIVNR